MLWLCMFIDSAKMKKGNHKAITQRNLHNKICYLKGKENFAQLLVIPCNFLGKHYRFGLLSSFSMIVFNFIVQLIVLPIASSYQPDLILLRLDKVNRLLRFII